MAGRPKLADSRDKQYRVRLNDEEDDMLKHISQATGIPKSEVFRHALVDLYHKVRVNETVTDEDSFCDIWEDDGISLQRVVGCPYCEASNRVDFSEECSVSVDEDRQMGEETTYEFNSEITCIACARKFRVNGFICEYPPGAFNYEEINVSKI